MEKIVLFLENGTFLCLLDKVAVVHDVVDKGFSKIFVFVGHRISAHKVGLHESGFENFCSFPRKVVKYIANIIETLFLEKREIDIVPEFVHEDTDDFVFGSGFEVEKLESIGFGLKTSTRCIGFVVEFEEEMYIFFLQNLAFYQDFQVFHTIEIGEKWFLRIGEIYPLDRFFGSKFLVFLGDFVAIFIDNLLVVDTKCIEFFLRIAFDDLSLGSIVRNMLLTIVMQRNMRMLVFFLVRRRGKYLPDDTLDS